MECKTRVKEFVWNVVERPDSKASWTSVKKATEEELKIATECLGVLTSGLSVLCPSPCQCLFDIQQYINRTLNLQTVLLNFTRCIPNKLDPLTERFLHTSTGHYELHIFQPIQTSSRLNRLQPQKVQVWGFRINVYHNMISM